MVMLIFTKIAKVPGYEITPNLINCKKLIININKIIGAKVFSMFAILKFLYLDFMKIIRYNKYITNNCLA